MKIAFDHQIFAGQRFGGISRCFFRLAQSLGVSGEHVRIVAPFHRNRYLHDSTGLTVCGLDIDRMPLVLSNRLLAANRSLESIATRIWAPDVVHETYYSLKSRRHSGSACVVTIHDMIHELFPDEFPNAAHMTRCKQLAVERADHVICVSDHTRRDLIELFKIPEDRVSVVHHGFDALDEPAAEALSPPARPYLLYVGNRGGYKNFHSLLRAVSASPHLKGEFDIVAFGGGSFVDAELASLVSLGFREGQVRQQGGDDFLLGHLYRNARAFVYPSLYEGFGLPPLEAMASSCPVISSNASCMPEVIGDAARFFDPNYPDELRQCIEDVVFGEQERAALVLKGKMRLNEFSWSKCASETLASYRHASTGRR